MGIPGWLKGEKFKSVLSQKRSSRKFKKEAAERFFPGETVHFTDKDGRVRQGTVRIRAVYCGKKCKGCPHKIYAYVRYRDGKKVREKYLGIAR